MLTYTKSEELMLAKEAGYMEKLQEIPDLNVSALAAMAALYRAGWRECWMEEAKAQPVWTLEDSLGVKEEGTDDVR